MNIIGWTYPLPPETDGVAATRTPHPGNGRQGTDGGAESPTTPPPPLIPPSTDPNALKAAKLQKVEQAAQAHGQAVADGIQTTTDSHMRQAQVSKILVAGAHLDHQIETARQQRITTEEIVQACPSLTPLYVELLQAPPL